MGERIQLRLLGEFECRRGNELVSLTGKKARALLAYLAQSPGQLHTREKLASLLWGDRFDKQARQSLRQAVVVLRKDLCDLPETEIFFGDRERLGVVAGAIDVDVLQFQDAIINKTIDGARKASELYRGDLLADISSESEEFEAWLIPERQRLRGFAEGAYERIARHEADAGRGDAALAAAQHLLNLDPTQESSHYLLIGLLARFRGSRAAVRQFQACSDILRRELDAAPSATTLRLIDEIKRRPAKLPSEPYESLMIRPAISAAVQRPNRTKTVATAAMSVAVAGAIAWLALAVPGVTTTTNPAASGLKQASVHPQPNTMSLMVLPFSDYASPEVSHIAVAFTDDLVTDLSLIPGMFVIANATSLAYRNLPADPRQIGRELGVNYLLSGGVRLVDGELRVNVALVDARTGGQVWAQHFHGREGQRLGLEDEIVGSLVANMHLELTLLEAMRSARDRPNSAALDDLLVRGRAARMRGPTPENVREALAIYSQALELAPNSAWAAAGLAASYVISVTQSQSTSPGPDIERAGMLIERALSENPRCFFCWHVKGMILHTSGRYAEAVAAFERSITINPNYPYAHAQLGAALPFLGRAQDTAAHIERATRLSPRDPLIPLWLTTAGNAQLLLGNDGRAVEILREAASGSPRYARLYRVFAAALLLAGDNNGARQAMATFRALAAGSPAPAPEAAHATDPTYSAQQARISNAIRQAGL